MDEWLRKAKGRISGAWTLLRMKETYYAWWSLAFAIGLLLPISYDWLEDHTIVVN